MSLSLTYLGLKGTQPQFRLDFQREGEARRFEIGISTNWEATTLLAELTPTLPSRSIYLALKIVRADADTVRVQCTTTMRMVYEGKWDTLGFDFLQMNDTAETSQTDFVKWLAGREQASLEEESHFLQPEHTPQPVVTKLLEPRYV